jgi:hypothetical protein
LIAVADFYAGINLLIGAKNRISGIGLCATDSGWTYGGGLEVRGSLVAIILAMTGRTRALDDLEGEGVQVRAGKGHYRSSGPSNASVELGRAGTSTAPPVLTRAVRRMGR